MKDYPRRCFQGAVLELVDPDNAIVLQGGELLFRIIVSPPEGWPGGDPHLFAAAWQHFLAPHLHAEVELRVPAPHESHLKTSWVPTVVLRREAALVAVLTAADESFEPGLPGGDSKGTGDEAGDVGNGGLPLSLAAAPLGSLEVVFSLADTEVHASVLGTLLDLAVTLACPAVRIMPPQPHPPQSHSHHSSVEAAALRGLFSYPVGPTNYGGDGDGDSGEASHLLSPPPPLLSWRRDVNVRRSSAPAVGSASSATATANGSVSNVRNSCDGGGGEVVVVVLEEEEEEEEEGTGTHDGANSRSRSSSSSSSSSSSGGRPQVKVVAPLAVAASPPVLLPVFDNEAEGGTHSSARPAPSSGSSCCVVNVFLENSHPTASLIVRDLRLHLDRTALATWSNPAAQHICEAAATATAAATTPPAAHLFSNGVEEPLESPPPLPSPLPAVPSETSSLALAAARSLLLAAAAFPTATSASTRAGGGALSSPPYSCSPLLASLSLSQQQRSSSFPVAIPLVEVDVSGAFAVGWNAPSDEGNDCDDDDDTARDSAENEAPSVSSSSSTTSTLPLPPQPSLLPRPAQAVLPLCLQPGDALALLLCVDSALLSHAAARNVNANATASATATASASAAASAADLWGEAKEGLPPAALRAAAASLVALEDHLLGNGNGSDNDNGKGNGNGDRRDDEGEGSGDRHDDEGCGGGGARDQRRLTLHSPLTVAYSLLPLPENGGALPSPSSSSSSSSSSPHAQVDDTQAVVVYPLLWCLPLCQGDAPGKKEKGGAGGLVYGVGGARDESWGEVLVDMRVVAADPPSEEDAVFVVVGKPFSVAVKVTNLSGRGKDLTLCARDTPIPTLQTKDDDERNGRGRRRRRGGGGGRDAAGSSSDDDSASSLSGEGAEGLAVLAIDTQVCLELPAGSSCSSDCGGVGGCGGRAPTSLLVQGQSAVAFLRYVALRPGLVTLAPIDLVDALPVGGRAVHSTRGFASLQVHARTAVPCL